jgi:two-component system NarL family sensor kinase
MTPEGGPSRVAGTRASGTGRARAKGGGRRAARRPSDPTVAGAVARFALAGVIALAIVGVVSVLVMRSVGTREALGDAREVTRLVGKGIVEPNLTQGVVEGRLNALARFDRLIRRRVLRDPIVRVKLWQASGRLAYSDEPRLIGQRYRLGADELTSLRDGGVESEVSDLSRPENRFDRGHGKLVEVYLPVRTPAGKPLLFEAYQRFGSVTSSGRDLWLAFLPALLLALVVLELVQLPLASSMARRIRRASAEREALLQRAVDSSTAERRRIAGDLHDGAVQDLAGLSFSLAAAAERGEPERGEALRRGAERARQSVRDLRSLLVEIYPPRLREAGLEAALSDLLAPLARRGIETTLEVPPGLALESDAEALLFRVAREAIRNAAKHAEPHHVEVRVSQSPEHTALTVEDDGRGPSVPIGAEGAEDAEGGHLGLRLLHDLASEAGAELEIDSRPGRGTTVRVRMERE